MLEARCFGETPHPSPGPGSTISPTVPPMGDRDATLLVVPLGRLLPPNQPARGVPEGGMLELPKSKSTFSWYLFHRDNLLSC